MTPRSSFGDFHEPNARKLPAVDPADVERGRAKCAEDAERYSLMWDWILAQTPVAAEPPEDTVVYLNVSKDPFNTTFVCNAALRARGYPFTLVDNATIRDTSTPLPGCWAEYIPRTSQERLVALSFSARTVNGIFSFLRNVLSRQIGYYHLDPTYEIHKEAQAKLAGLRPEERASMLAQGFMTSQVISQVRLGKNHLIGETYESPQVRSAHNVNMALYGRLAFREEAEGGPVRPFNVERIFGIGEGMLNAALKLQQPDA